MRTMIRRSVHLIVLLLALSLAAGQAQRPESAASPTASATIAAKKPVFAGACKACPWGILAKVTADALSYYGYQTTICWVCWSSFGPREMGDRTKPVTPPGAFDNPEYVEPPPDAVPDISATSESNLIDAWNGTGPYASDGKQRRNYRAIAVIRTSTYMLAAASRKSGITNLRQIKDRTQPTWIVRGAAHRKVSAGTGVSTGYRAVGAISRSGPPHPHRDAAQSLDLCTRRCAGLLCVRCGESSRRTPGFVPGSARAMVLRPANRRREQNDSDASRSDEVL